VFIMGQNPGEQEEKEGIPFVGATGQMMDRTYLPLAGLSREEVSVGNVLRCRVNRGGRRSNDMPVGETYDSAVKHCTTAHFTVPPHVKLIVAQGAHAWRLLTGGQGSIHGGSPPRRYQGSDGGS